ncbi:MAG: ATP-binding cassette domain-containing protein [Micropruina sp.]|nr:ATP-binding cassette domain-containing protein [Micropruina sp.]
MSTAVQAPPIVSISGLTRVFGTGDAQVVALDGIDLTVVRGEFVAVMGPSGCGKSTLLNLIGGLDTPTAGQVTIDGDPLTSLNDDRLTELRRRRIGFVFQFFNLIPVLSALENASLPLRLDGDRNANRAATEWLEKVGLGARLAARPDQLSGGQQQRVAIARALSTEPALVLADEPTGNLDSKSSTGVAELLQRVCAEWGRTVLMVTHDPRIAAYAGRLVLMNDGRIVDDLTLDGSRDAPPAGPGESGVAVILQATLAWRYLAGRGTRSLLTTLAVALGVMLTFGLSSITPALEAAFTRSLLSSAGQIDLTVTDAYNQSFPADVAARVAAVPGVAAVSAEVQRTATLPTSSDPGPDEVAQLTLIGIDPGQAAKVRSFPLAAGRMLAGGDLFAAILAGDLATRLHVGVGDELTVPSALGTARFRVVGLLSTPSVPGESQVFVPLKAAQQVFSLGGRITVLQAAFAPHGDRAAVERAVATALGPDFQVGGLSSQTGLMASVQVANYAFLMFGLFALATAGFIILNSFRTVVAERRRDIGMLRAIGMRRRTITGMFAIESLLQGILGTAVGLVLGWAMALGAFALFRRLVSSVLHMDLGDPVFSASTLAMAVLLGLGVTVAAALIPARAAGRMTPLEAMRPQVGEVYARRTGRWAWVGAGLVVASVFGLTASSPSLVGLGAVIFLIGVALVAPAIVVPVANAVGRPLELIFSREGAIARSNLQRNPGRSAVTVTAVMLGLAAIVAMITVIASIFAGFYRYLDRSMSADYMLIPQSIVLGQGNVAAGPRLAQAVAGTPGVRAASSIRVSQGKVDGSQVQVLGIDPERYLDVASFDWNAGSSDQAVAQLRGGRWVIANGIYAAQHGLVVGQPILIATPNGERTYHLAGIGNDYLNAKLSTLYTSQANLERDFNVTADLMVLANRELTASPEAVQQRLQRLVNDYPAFKLYESATWKTEQTNTFNNTLIVFDILIGALAIPSLLALMNTLAISVLSRRREIGMLRAIGSTRRQIRRMVMAESLLLSVIGTMLGLVAGLWLGYALVAAMAAVGWQMPYAFPWSGLLVTVVVGMVFGMLAAVGPARQAARLDIVAALRQE